MFLSAPAKAVLILHHVVVSARAASACVRLEDTTMPHPLQLLSMGFLDLPPSSAGRGQRPEKYSGLRPSLRDVPSTFS